MEQVNLENKDHFHGGHLATIALAALVLVGFAVLKNDFHLFANSQASTQKVYTYAMALQDAKNQLGSSDASANTQSQSVVGAGQVAMIDPSLTQGQVLGESTGTSDSLSATDQIIPDAEEALTPAVLVPIKVKLVAETNAGTINKYKNDITLIETRDGADTILFDISNQSSATLKDASDRAKTVARDLLQVQVPKELETYHKVHMIYYIELGMLSDGYAGISGAQNTQDVGVQILSVNDELGRLQTAISKKYGVQL